MEREHHTETLTCGAASEYNKYKLQTTGAEIDQTAVGLHASALFLSHGRTNRCLVDKQCIHHGPPVPLPACRAPANESESSQVTGSGLPQPNTFLLTLRLPTPALRNRVWAQPLSEQHHLGKTEVLFPHVPAMPPIMHACV